MMYYNDNIKALPSAQRAQKLGAPSVSFAPSGSSIFKWNCSVWQGLTTNGVCCTETADFGNLEPFLGFIDWEESTASTKVTGSYRKWKIMKITAIAKIIWEFIILFLR